MQPNGRNKVANFVRCSTSQGLTIYLNVDQIKWIQRSRNGYTTVHFGTDCGANVQETPEDLIRGSSALPKRVKASLKPSAVSDRPGLIPSISE
jgi:hypothetical protein